MQNVDLQSGEKVESIEYYRVLHKQNKDCYLVLCRVAELITYNDWKYGVLGDHCPKAIYVLSRTVCLGCTIKQCQVFTHFSLYNDYLPN